MMRLKLLLSHPSVPVMLAAVALVRLLAWGSDGLTLVQRVPVLAAFTEAVKDLEKERRQARGLPPDQRRLLGPGWRCRLDRGRGR